MELRETSDPAKGRRKPAANRTKKLRKTVTRQAVPGNARDIRSSRVYSNSRF